MNTNEVAPGPNLVFSVIDLINCGRNEAWSPSIKTARKYTGFIMSLFISRSISSEILAPGSVTALRLKEIIRFKNRAERNPDAISRTKKFFA